MSEETTTTTTTIKEVEVWLSRTNNGKAFTVSVGDTAYIGAMSSLAKVCDHSKKAVKLGLLVKE